MVGKIFNYLLLTYDIAQSNQVPAGHLHRVRVEFCPKLGKGIVKPRRTNLHFFEHSLIAPFYGNVIAQPHRDTSYGVCDNDGKEQSRRTKTELVPRKRPGSLRHFNNIFFPPQRRRDKPLWYRAPVNATQTKRELWQFHFSPLFISLHKS